MALQTIREAALSAGLPVKTVRYYDEIGLVRSSARSPAGYRLYDATACHKLTFVQRARQFNFSLDECRELLDLYENRQRPSREVKKLALAKVDFLQQRLATLSDLKQELEALAERCSGDDRPDCPILTAMAGDQDADTVQRRPRSKDEL